VKQQEGVVLEAMMAAAAASLAMAAPAAAAAFSCMYYSLERIYGTQLMI
jgi:hypothetical protein